MGGLDTDVQTKALLRMSEKIAIYKSGSRNLEETKPAGVKFLDYQSLQLEEQILCRNHPSLVFVIKASCMHSVFNFLQHLKQTIHLKMSNLISSDTT